MLFGKIVNFKFSVKINLSPNLCFQILVNLTEFRFEQSKVYEIRMQRYGD